MFIYENSKVTLVLPYYINLVHISFCGHCLNEPVPYQIYMYSTLCPLGFFPLFCRLLNLFKVNFSKNYFRNMIRVSNSLDPDLASHSVQPDLGPNCLQRLSADNPRR